MKTKNRKKKSKSRPKFKIERNFPIWKIWRIPRHLRHKKNLERFLLEQEDLIESRVNQAMYNYEVFGGEA